MNPIPTPGYLHLKYLQDKKPNKKEIDPLIRTILSDINKKLDSYTRRPYEHHRVILPGFLNYLEIASLKNNISMSTIYVEQIASRLKAKGYSTQLIGNGELEITWERPGFIRRFINRIIARFI